MPTPGNTPLDHNDLDDTGSLTTRLIAVREGDPHAPVTMSDFKPVASALSKLLQAADRDAGRATVIRAIGGLAATAAISMAGLALTYVSQMTRDHDRLDRVESEAAELVEDNNVRAVELAGSAARIEASIERIADNVARIDRRLDAMESRMTAYEHDRR